MDQVNTLSGGSKAATNEKAGLEDHTATGTPYSNSKDDLSSEEKAGSETVDIVNGELHRGLKARQ